MIEEFLTQLTFAPLPRRPLEEVRETLVIGGMGGSAIAGDALAFLLPHRHIVVHRNYTFPAFVPQNAFYIAISYSGNTEETLSFANTALKEGRRLGVVTSGGALARLAEREHLPLVLVPEGVAPRNALVYLTKALAALVGEEDRFSSLHIESASLEEESEDDAHFMLPSVPLIYSSGRNAFLGSVGKVLLNESARMPAFTNVFPELTHNEMQAFDTDMPEGLVHLFRFFLIRDEADGERIGRRMDIFTSLMEERGHFVRTIDITGMTREEALVQVWIRFACAARLLAEARHINPDSAPLIEAFKKLL